jgi:hypothetical protein
VAPAPPTAPLVEPDPQSPRREALFDIAFHALVAGDLAQAELAFRAAAQLGGNLAARAVAESFATRVAALRAARAAGAAAPSPGRAAASSRPDSRADVTAAAVVDNSGRVPLLLTTTALGIGLYGWSLPGMLSIHTNENPRTFVGLYMLSAASAFVVPFMLTRDRPISAGQANLAFYGGTRGAYLGVLTAAVLAGNVSPNTRYAGFTGGLMGGSVVGLSAAAWFAGRTALTPGQAHTMSVFADFGTALGFGIGYLGGFTGGGATSDQVARRMAMMGLLGTGAGLFTGYQHGHWRDNTWGDAEVMRAAGFLGIFAAGALADQFEPSGKEVVTTLLVGGLAGAVVGDRLVANADFTVAQAVVVDLATVAGAAGTAGLLYLFSPSDWSERPFLIAAALGGTAALGISTWALRDNGGPSARAQDRRAASGFQYALLPMLGTGAGAVRGVTLAAGF